MVAYLPVTLLLANNIRYNREWFAPDQDHSRLIHATNEAWQTYELVTRFKLI